MKKSIQFLALVAVVLGIQNIQAQTDSKSTDNGGFGIRGGVNFSNLYSDDVDDNNVLTGFNVGIFAQAPLAPGIALQPEVNFSTKGAELQYNNALFQGTAKFNLSYVEIPLLLKINLTKNLNIHGGPYAAFLVSSKITNEDANGNINFEDQVNRDDLNKFDYGLAGGIGFDVDNFGLGIRYNYGLQTIGKERSYLGSTYTFPDAKNSSLSIYAAIKF